MRAIFSRRENKFGLLEGSGVGGGDWKWNNCKFLFHGSFPSPSSPPVPPHPSPTSSRSFLHTSLHYFPTCILKLCWIFFPPYCMPSACSPPTLRRANNLKQNNIAPLNVLISVLNFAYRSSPVPAALIHSRGCHIACPFPVSFCVSCAHLCMSAKPAPPRSPVPHPP